MKGRFTNPYIANIRRKSRHFLLWKLGYYNDQSEVITAPESFNYPQNSLLPFSQEAPKLLWVNHSTFLIEAYGATFLTDPIWSDRCSPFSFLGPKRRHEPGIALDLIEKVDFVLISHDHYDHLDKPTVERLHHKFPNIQWIVPFGLKRWFKRLGISQVQELLWWGKRKFAYGSEFPHIEVTAVPAQHNSGRGFFDWNKTLWAGYVVKIAHEKFGTKSLYFVGDSAYNPYDFKKIGERFPSLDLCLCPIGTYKPERFMRTVHSSPGDAVQIHCDTRTKLSVGMHWKTFTLSSEPFHQPPYDLFCEMNKLGLDPHRFLAIEPGEMINW